MIDIHLHKLPPHNTDAEESIISSMMLDNSCHDDVVSILKPEDFYKTSHQYIFRAIVWLLRKKHPVDLVTVAEALKKNGKIEEIGGATFLAQIIDSVPMAVNAIHYANIVKEKAILRRMIEESNKITEMCFHPEQESNEAIDYATRSFAEISESTFDKSSIKSSKELAHNVLNKIEEGEKTGIITGIFKLDLMLCGFQKTELSMIAARPSMGKTSLALSIAQNIAGVDHVFIKSYETPSEGLAKRNICSISGVSSHKIKNQSLTKSDWKKINDAADQYSTLKINIDDKSSDTVQDIRRKCLKLKKAGELDIMFIDHLARMPVPKAERHEIGIGNITTGLSNLAKELDIPIVLLHQLNRQCEARVNKRPMLSDLRDSGRIEQDLDVIMFIYRDSVYADKEGREALNYDEIIVSKNRDGERGMVKVKFIPELTRFVDYDEGGMNDIKARQKR